MCRCGDVQIFTSAFSSAFDGSAFKIKASSIEGASASRPRAQNRKFVNVQMCKLFLTVVVDELNGALLGVAQEPFFIFKRYKR